MNKELIEAVRVIEKEKGIDAEKIFIALENSLLAACKGLYGRNDNIDVVLDREKGDLKILARKTVVEEVADSLTQISLEDAMKIRSNVEIDDKVSIELDYKKFSRIAAQNAKNIMLQTVREEERNKLYESYKEKEGTIITGIVQRKFGSKVSVNIGKLDAMIPENEQIPGEIFTPTQRIKVYIAEVKMGNKGPRITASRSRAELVQKLFENEVAEIRDGVVEIKNITREAGSRTKMAVYSNDPNVDPVGSCVGLNVARVNAIIEELRGEKIDIVNWSEDSRKFIENALAPAKVISVDVDEDEKHAMVIVPDYQLSLAIGKEGQNARLAAKLTGYRIDIKSESEGTEDIHDYEEYNDDGDLEGSDDIFDLDQVFDTDEK